MAASFIKLSVLSIERPYSGSLIDFVINISGTSPLSELVGGEALKGTMATVTQESFRAITFNRSPACLDRILVVTGDPSAVVADHAVRKNQLHRDSVYAGEKS
jgi:hypothetical protein